MLFRKLLRTMWQYKAQFLSMIIMIALGVGILVGFNMEWVSIEENTKYLFESTGLADYRLVSEKTYPEDDLHKIEAIPGVDAASRFFSVNVDVTSYEGDTLALTVTENPEVSGFILKDGETYDPESTDGFWLSESYAKANGISIGDELQVKYSLFKLNGTVKGLVQSGEYMICVRDSSQLMPDFGGHGFLYISPAMFKKVTGMSYYPQIHVISSLSKEEFTKAADEALKITSLILTKNEVISYAQAQGEAAEGKTMGSVMPVVFLLIAILTMVTTMHRLTLKERTQIGTLKALGFKDKQIIRHYTSYALMIGIAGTIIGVILGYVIAGYIMNENGMMGTYFDMPQWKLYLPWFCCLIIAAIIALMTFIGYLSVKKLLRGTAADTLRNDFTEKQRSLKIEKTKWFHKRSFGTRWNIRDIARHKSRTAMSLIGVVGCTVIIIAVLGMQDTMNAFLENYFNKESHYNSRIYLTENIKDDQLKTLTDAYGSDTSESISVQLEEKAVSLDIYELPTHMLSFQSDKYGYVDLPSEGAFICQRLADIFHISAGDVIEVSPFGSDETYSLKVEGISRSLTECIMQSREYAETLGIEYKPDSIYTILEKSDISADAAIKSVQSKQMIMDSFDSFIEILNAMVFVMILAGIILGIVVLYNLGVMSYAERYREMATLKVLGFKDRKIGNLLIEQNLWISLAGMVIGLPLGALVLAYLVKALATEYELQTVIRPLSYVLTALLTLGMSFVVSLLVSRKNKKIDMVEALKSAE